MFQFLSHYTFNTLNLKSKKSEKIEKYVNINYFLFTIYFGNERVKLENICFVLATFLSFIHVENKKKTTCKIIKQIEHDVIET